ncbi:DUF4234 domain-containing protein [Pectobacterium parmentieri]|uniref:DUF4234 domain-containing protein n=1 Tax=Pectobacterium parmentieri TaxID=1905730 RepID=A0A0H3HXK4_PECPM|nr:DUF4234 domain-containing protein [Pectobacterium parmentieri]ACX86297.1 conserved hypothetical protein [Pectobacterium parmentieri WPP163]AFI88611.1 Hypothetical protein W5S_0485 [Pectobacterium parmentieri]MBI0471759.1 DUF4234 domain-containing protein [Pectobacterium parmentieri]MBI0494444.1 DUF4234 domain-containing protein [Pectobacterium parmentieri]MBI0555733.1 DUF4234 domain-containing protein [Pectobacterium parmentieri]
MSDISDLKQRLDTKTLNFVLLTMVTCGVWPIVWLFKKQNIISEVTKYPFSNELFVLWIAICFGMSRQLASMVSPDIYGYDPTNDTLLALSGILSLASVVLYVVWAFKARTALRHYALMEFKFDLKMNVFYTIVFNVYYITYCINAMPDALAKHKIIYGSSSFVGDQPKQTPPTQQ